jgi:GNAT superfamily N-acetyltransferase
MTARSTQSTAQSVTIRPLRATDTELEADFVRHLSVEAKRLRFFGGVKELTPAELKLMCEVDGERSMAFVATVLNNGQETAIGVSRYAPSAQAGAREMAITVADEWQLTGIAERLMARLIDYARAHGVKRLYSVELAENYAMKELARRLGMTAERDPQDATQSLYSLTL